MQGKQRKETDEIQEEQITNIAHSNVYLNRNQEIRFHHKKKSHPVDKEHLYAENITLKNKLQELLDVNTKIKTQLLISEKQKHHIYQIAEEEAFHPKIIQRSQSGNKKSAQNIISQQQGNANLANIAKDKQTFIIKKMMRDYKDQIEKVKQQNTRIKKQMKYTRMNELLIENKQWSDENMRLQKIIREMRETQNQNINLYLNEIDNLKKKLVQEKDSEKKNGFQLKKIGEQFSELKDKYKDLELKKVQAEKRLQKEIKSMKSQLIEYKSKQFSDVKAKECAECLKVKKQNILCKKKIENLERELKKYQDDLQYEKKKILIKEMQDKKKYESKKSNESSRINHSEKDKSLKAELNQQEKKQKTIQKIEAKHQKEEKSNEIKQKQQKNNKLKEKQQKSNEIKQKQINKDEEKQVREEKSPTNHELKQKNIVIQSQRNHQKDQENQLKLESQSGYSEIGYDQFEQEQPIKMVEEIKKQQKKIRPITAEKSKETIKKNAKELKKEESSDEEILFQQEEHEETETKGNFELNKAELKIIKETLIYKFMAQLYTYESFCQDIRESKVKNFKIGEIVGLLGEEPFLLSENHTESVLIYLFEKNQLEGSEEISSKSFMKKMKKFIGKTYEVDEAKEQSYLDEISTIIDENLTKIKNKLQSVQKDDGLVTKKDLTSILGSVGLKNEALECAIAQAVYVSSDINHINHDLFLKRFTEANI